MILPLRWIAFLCFLFSGAASVSYQTIWLRQAMTYFGVITPVNSAVLSVFMAGLALGIVVAGKITTRITAARALLIYACVEIAIGCLALCVPYFFKAGYLVLLGLHSQQSADYLFWSCIIITVILLPVCTLIGATFPLLMKYIESNSGEEKNFSLLYFANLYGALFGCLFPCIVIELFGFSGSLKSTALLNAVAALAALYAYVKIPPGSRALETEKVPSIPHEPIAAGYMVVLFSLGFIGLGCEVIWIKAFMPVIAPTVYSFAFILAVYIFGNTCGTAVYRNHQQSPLLAASVLVLLPVGGLLTVVGSSYIVFHYLAALSVFSIMLLCFCFGYLTPKLVDEVCHNDPRIASMAYMYNCIGCIAGPAFSTYILFPSMGIKGGLIVLACGLLCISWFLMRSAGKLKWAALALFTAMLACGLKMPNQEDFIVESGGMLTRDHIGYIGAVGTGMDKMLLVNGIGMTNLTTITKNMAHVTLAHHPEAKSALTICFGMGTTTRSLTSWPLDKITAVELSPGVIKSFGYFHEDAARVLADPRVHIIADDGRRFLNRSEEKFDVIIIDPPPPIPAPGSGLLYSTDFLQVLKPHLAQGGILQHWIPSKDSDVFVNSAVNALSMNFKYIKLFKPISDPIAGIHILASDSPIPDITPEEFVKRLPPKAAEDAREWKQNLSLLQLAQASLQTIDKEKFLNPAFSTIYMSDDRLYNEFYMLRLLHFIAY